MSQGYRFLIVETQDKSDKLRLVKLHCCRERERERDRGEELGKAFVRGGNELQVGKAATFGANNLDGLNSAQLRRGEGLLEIGCLHA